MITKIPPNAKLTAHEWAALIPGDTIIDPDGFRHNDGVTMDTPITRADFLKRRDECTVMCRKFYGPALILN